MATTYEYPPSLARHRPGQFDRSIILAGSARFQHHFFLTRFKVLAMSVLNDENAGIQYFRFLNDELVGFSLPSNSFHIL